MNRIRALVLIALLSACGAHATFELSSSADNDAGALAAALARRQLPAAPAPLNTSGAPRVFAVTGGPGPHAIIAFDLAAGRPLWTVTADIQSRIAVGADFIVAREGNQLVARDQASGAPRWRAAIAGTYVGAAADRERAYLVWTDAATKRSWLAAYDGAHGGQLWAADAAGALGAPAAQGGLVYAPFLDQWLSIVDGKTGRPLARVRGLDEQISTVRVTSQVAYFGSRQGVFRLDDRAATGTRAGGSYARVALPPQLERTLYGPDAYDPVQATYTAADRARVLWSARPTGPFELTDGGDGGYAIAYFRFVFGYRTDGTLRWAYDHPRVELVATTDTGGALALVSTTGELVALDPATGAVRWTGALHTTAPVIGATFDADGWAPPGSAAAAAPAADATVAALVAIVHDRDARFDGVKELAVGALAKLPGAGPTTELLAVLADDRAPQRLKDAAVDALMTRADPASLPVLVGQLAVHTDFIKHIEPDALGPVAKAIGALADAQLSADKVAAALVALRGHLDDPATAQPDLVVVIDAMAAIGGGAAQPALTSHLLLYHADDELGGDPAWDHAITTALATHGGAAGRAALRAVAADPRTVPGLIAAIHDVLP